MTGYIERSYQDEIKGLTREVLALVDAAAAGIVTRERLADDLATANRLVILADRVSKEVKCMYRNNGNTEALRLASKGYDKERKGVEIGPRVVAKGGERDAG